MRKLTPERQAVKMAMVFALDHSEQAKSVVKYDAANLHPCVHSVITSSCYHCVHVVNVWLHRVLMESLTLAQTPIPKKLARLYLISDILHNSSTAYVRGASLYRSEYAANTWLDP